MLLKSTRARRGQERPTSSQPLSRNTWGSWEGAAWCPPDPEVFPTLFQADSPGFLYSCPVQKGWLSSLLLEMLHPALLPCLNTPSRLRSAVLCEPWKESASGKRRRRPPRRKTPQTTRGWAPASPPADPPGHLPGTQPALRPRLAPPRPLCQFSAATGGKQRKRRFTAPCPWSEPSGLRRFGSLHHSASSYSKAALVSESRPHPSQQRSARSSALAQEQVEQKRKRNLEFMYFFLFSAGLEEAAWPQLVAGMGSQARAAGQDRARGGAFTGSCSQTKTKARGRRPRPAPGHPLPARSGQRDAATRTILGNFTVSAQEKRFLLRQKPTCNLSPS